MGIRSQRMSAEYDKTDRTVSSDAFWRRSSDIVLNGYPGKGGNIFSIRNGHLYRREGFYIYYDRHAAVKLKKMEYREEKTEEVNLPETDEVTFMQPDEPVYDIKEKEDTNDIDILEEELYMEESMQPDEPGLQPHPERKRQGRYRKQLEEAEKTEKTEEAKIPAYSSLVLAVVVLTLGFTAYQNHKKMNEMENTLAQMNQVHIVTEMPETEKRQILGSWWKILQGI